MGKNKRDHSSSKTSKPSKKVKKTSEPQPSATSVATAALAAHRPMSKISNKLKRGEVYAKWLKEKRKLKKQVRDAKREEKDNGEEGDDEGKTTTTPKNVPRTLENTREVEDTIVSPTDPEILADEEDDEFSPYYSCVIKPKILITTRPRPSAELFGFISALLTLIPNSYYYPRRDYEIKDITKYSRNKMFSHLIILSEKSKKCNGMLVSHLGVPAESSGIWKEDGKKVWEDEEEEGEDWEDEEEEEEEEEEMEDWEEKGKGVDDEDDDSDGDDDGDGDVEVNDISHDDNDDESSSPFPLPPSPTKTLTPTSDDVLPGPTAFFKVNNIILPKRISNHGTATSHIPELILNNFTTRLGHRAGRFFGSLFPHSPEFRGRQAVTFHNQRDYVFVRHHRYIFHKGERKGDDGKTRARLQELGPRFSLKMRWMLAGGFDTRFGEYEFYHKRKEMDTSRRKFHL